LTTKGTLLSADSAGAAGRGYYTLAVGNVTDAGWIYPARPCKTIAMDAPGARDDVLSQPSRARLFQLLSELQRPAHTEELAELLELHPNGVRAHLERLREAGLVARAREPRPRGRPRDSWSIEPAAVPSADPPTAYADLSRWLVRDVAARKSPIRQVESTGRAIGQELALTGAPGSPEQQMHRALAVLGFRPSREPDPGGRTLTYTLGNCPYREAVRENQRVVCALHRGLTRGLLDGISPTTKLSAFTPHDPYAAGCTIRLSGPIADEAATRTS
jgi:predicted ArsR family transcriptional regulator